MDETRRPGRHYTAPLIHVRVMAPTGQAGEISEFMVDDLVERHGYDLIELTPERPSLNQDGEGKVFITLRRK